MKRIGIPAAVRMAGTLALTLAMAVASAGPADLERGKYLVKIAGCNDCHTPGYLMSAGQVPEELWLTGDSFGWRGPWGTTYAINLRLRMQQFTEGEWVKFAKALKARPPMPWYTLNEMHEADLKAIYRFIRHLGSGGHEAPAFVPPEQEPKPPFALFPPPPPGNRLIP